MPRVKMLLNKQHDPNAGREIYLCPGTSNRSRIFPMEGKT